VSNNFSLLLLFNITIPASVYDCVSSPTVIDAQFIKLKNI